MVKQSKQLPENRECQLEFLASRLTPNDLFFSRNHMPYPEPIELHDWTLSIEGCVEKPMNLRYDDIRKMPIFSLPVTLECAGNKRSLFDPTPAGLPWGIGAISHAMWTGVPLRHVLSLANVTSTAREVVFEGLDFSVADDEPNLRMHYERSLSIERARHPDTMLALYMNGKPLPHRHGFPLRLIVPGWYGMASVKWLHRITVLDHQFEGTYQTQDYVLMKEPGNYTDVKPITEAKVNSVIAGPMNDQVLLPGTCQIHGFAWAGSQRVALVQISLDGGTTWMNATLLDSAQQYAWSRWELEVEFSTRGKHQIMVRAIDENGSAQPEEVEWNVRGYANNSIHKIFVHVR